MCDLLRFHDFQVSPELPISHLAVLPRPHALAPELPAPLLEEVAQSDIQEHNRDPISPFLLPLLALAVLEQVPEQGTKTTGGSLRTTSPAPSRGTTTCLLYTSDAADE